MRRKGWKRPWSPHKKIMKIMMKMRRQSPKATVPTALDGVQIMQERTKIRKQQKMVWFALPLALAAAAAAVVLALAPGVEGVHIRRRRFRRSKKNRDIKATMAEPVSPVDVSVTPEYVTPEDDPNNLD